MEEIPELGILSQSIGRIEKTLQNNGHSLSTVFEPFFGLIADLEVFVRSQKGERSKDKLRAIEKRMVQRKKARKEGERIIHFVCEPPDQLEDLSHRYYS